MNEDKVYHPGIAANKILHKAASRKGGLRKVKKGFAMNPELAREAGKKGALITNENKRNKVKKPNQTGANIADIDLEAILGDIDVS